MIPQLCLGTAQFGLPYGITNSGGQVPESEVALLLAQAADAGITLLDTAQAYGNAEEVLGRNLPLAHGFRLISKMPAQPQPVIMAEDALGWEKEFHRSCGRLGLDALDALLLHAPAELKKPGGAYLEEWLLGLRQRGLVKRLGLSIYGAEDLEGVNLELLDLVQLPLSLFDQRLLHDGTVTCLAERGTAIHARSVFLQGLLLKPAKYWPSWVGLVVREHQQALEVMAEERRCQLIDLALGFVRAQQNLEAVVLGLCSTKELAELLRVWSATSPWDGVEWRSWAINEPDILDPRRWPS